MKKIKSFDMFCGAGGSSLGARTAGVEVVGGVDLWDAATKSFKLNFPQATVFNQDLRTLDPLDVVKQVNGIDLLLSSPECTHHTCARGNKPRSEESKETALQVVRYAQAIRPRWIVLENVVHMRPWDRYPELKAELTALGYKLREQVLDASHFGVPQKRRRLFLLADREQMPPPVIAPVSVNNIAVKDILDAEGTWRLTPLRAPKRAKATLERADRAIAALGNQTPFLIVYYGSDGSGGWQSLDVPLRTITTVDRFALVLPTTEGHMMRMLQPTELRRAMGFPENYQFPEVGRRERVRLLGNAVCSPVMDAIVKTLCKDNLKQQSASHQAVLRGSRTDEQHLQSVRVAA